MVHEMVQDCKYQKEPHFNEHQYAFNKMLAYQASEKAYLVSCEHFPLQKGKTHFLIVDTPFLVLVW